MRKSLFLVFFLAASLAVILSSSSCSGGRYSGPPRSISIGSAPLESSLLLYIAEAQGFFAANGLTATIRQYDTGAAALTGLINREVDIAVPAEYALVGRAFQKQKVSAIASIGKAQYFYLVGRKDRGIEKVLSLRGKKIGVVTKTIAEFYLGRFLQLKGISPDQVTAVNIDITKSEKAILESDIDAIVSRPPYVSEIQQRLGANAITWPAQSSQALYAVLIGRNDWIAEQPETVNRLLKSLVEAEAYLIRHPPEARNILKKRLDVDDAYMATVWTENEFSLSLDQSLIAAMEDEARWMISNKLTTEKQAPDFLDYTHVDSLKAVKPEAVNIIR